jgi:cell division protein FtsB
MKKKNMKEQVEALQKEIRVLKRRTTILLKAIYLLPGGREALGFKTKVESITSKDRKSLIADKVIWGAFIVDERKKPERG